MILEHPRKHRQSTHDKQNVRVAKAAGVMQNPHSKQQATKWMALRKAHAKAVKKHNSVYGIKGQVSSRDGNF